LANSPFLSHNLTAVSRLFRKCGSLDVSQPCGPSWPATGIVLPFYFLAFLGSSARFVYWTRPSGFDCFGFRNNIFFYRPRSSALPPTPNLENRVSVFMPPETGWPSYTPRHRVPFSSPSDSQGYGGGILSRLHTEYCDKLSDTHASSVSCGRTSRVEIEVTIFSSRFSYLEN
jgi:hypothetical protein